MTLPFGATSIGLHPTFVRAVGITYATTEAVSAVLLLWRATMTRSAALSYLGAAYAMSTPIFIANLLALARKDVFAAHVGAAPWLSLGWHIAWCAMALAFVLTPQRTTRRPLLPAVIGFVVAIVFCALVAELQLPLFIDHNVTTHLGYIALSIMLAACAITTFAAFRAGGGQLGPWVGVAALALTMHVVLNLFSATRYSLGYYVARVIVAMNGLVVLGALTAAFVRAIRRADVSDATERRLRTLLEGLPHIVWTARADGSTDWCNSRWTEYTGEAAGALGWSWLDLHHPDDVAHVQERLRDSMETGKPYETEHRLRRSDGTYEWFLARMVPERNESGEIVRWYGSLTNIDAQKREMQRSSRVAQLMQQAFLPDALPSVHGATLDALYEPAESEALVGGDWYDVVRLASDRILITCGDVAGHGLDAAVLAGRYRHTLAFAAMSETDPAVILERVNHAAVTQRDTIATAIVAIADFSSRTLHYAIAGHPPPVIASRESAAFLPSGGLPLGVLLDAGYQTHSVGLPDESIVVFYTDGLVEFERDALAAMEAVRAAACEVLDDRSSTPPALAIKQRVMKSATRRDDVAVLVVQMTGAAAGERRIAHHPTKTWRFHSRDARSGHDARQAVAAFLREYADDSESLFQSELIIGEALANTVEHAPGLVEVTIDWTGEHAKLLVCDSGPGLNRPVDRTLPDPLSEDGRGLFIIGALSPDLQVRDIAGVGLELRCTLPIRRSVRALPGTL